MSMSHKDGNDNGCGETPAHGINRRDFIKITMAGVGGAAATMALGGCGSDPQQSPAATSTNFAVMSDLHYHDPALGTTSPEFLAYLANDRKMIAQSKELLDAAVADIVARKPDFVLVPGDLTKDGEKQNHQQVAAKLGQLRSKGIKVYVIPGNHDINNPASLSYTTSPPTAIANVSPTDFKSIYSDCGYGAALVQDPNSLSYVAEPVPGLWLIAIDSCKYANNATNVDPLTGKPAPVTSGSIDNTLAWIQTQLTAAKQQGKTVIGMLHHGLWEHFPGQSTLFADYLVDNWQTRSKTLSDAGLTVVFTGHFHANDVVRNDFTSSVLHDIETGSLVTAPSPYRFVQFDLAGRSMAISTSRVPSIPSQSNFVSFSQGFLYSGLAVGSNGSPGLVPQMLTLPAPYGLAMTNPTTVAMITPLISYAMMTHYYGDENGLFNTACSSQVWVNIDQTSSNFGAPVSTIGATSAPLAACAAGVMANVQTAAAADPTSAYLAGLINGVWADRSPADNTLTVIPNKAT